jgi:hypothetical protein
VNFEVEEFLIYLIITSHWGTIPTLWARTSCLEQADALGNQQLNLSSITSDLDLFEKDDTLVLKDFSNKATLHCFKTALKPTMPRNFGTMNNENTINS